MAPVESTPTSSTIAFTPILGMTRRDGLVPVAVGSGAAAPAGACTSGGDSA